MKELSEGIISLEIVDVTFPEGFGVAKTGDFVCFVPGALPGDIVSAKIARQNKRFAFAHIVSKDRESPFRVDPACPHVNDCGGCAFQELLYQKQLELKQNYLLQTLRRIGNVPVEGCEISVIMPSVAQYYYRSKVELFFGQDPAVAIGFKERVSPFELYNGRIVPISRCPIFSKNLEPLLLFFTEYAQRVHRGVRGKTKQITSLKKLVVREAKWDKKLMVSLVIEGEAVPERSWLMKDLQREIPEVASLWAVTNRKKELITGSPYLEEMLDGFRFRVYPETFFQPNAAMAGMLYESIAKQCRAMKSERILGLYCGTGTIEISLSPFAHEILAVDSNRENIAAAIENCRINEIRNCRFYAKTAERASNLLRGAGGLPRSFDVIIVDPPRAGLTANALDFITGLSVPHIIYISCNPSTLARDLKRFGNAHYIPEKIQPFDFFPHAAHLETLVLLEKRGKDKQR